jgi:hypothetical protein
MELRVNLTKWKDNGITDQEETLGIGSTTEVDTEGIVLESSETPRPWAGLPLLYLRSCGVWYVTTITSGG